MSIAIYFLAGVGSVSILSALIMCAMFAWADWQADKEGKQ